MTNTASVPASAPGGPTAPGGSGAPASRAGRNLPAASGVGVGLVAVVVVTLIWWHFGFVLLTAAALSLADLVGAAVTQLRPGHPVLNLLPPALRQQEGRRRRQPWLAAAAVLAVAALLPPLVHYRTVAVIAGEKTAAIERELAPWREREARNRAALQQLAEQMRVVGC